MSSVSRATARRLSYASGYLALGLLPEAAQELQAIAETERMSTEFMHVHSELLLATKQWEQLVAASEYLAQRAPGQTAGWINWAYALRELERVEDAKTILLQAEVIHPHLAVLHYNLACYYCLLGDMKEARRRLNKACRLDGSWKEAAASDPDLRRLR